MSKLTVLEMTQDILNEMDSDDVNSINDTVESMQIARIIRTSYYEIISAKYHKYFDRVKALDTAGSSLYPNYLILPSDVINVKWIRYNDEDIAYRDPEEFLEYQSRLTSNYTTVTDYDGVEYRVATNRDPKYYTSFDETHIAFDAYDSDVDSVLQSSKSKAGVYVDPVFTLEDDFTPDMPIQMFPQLLAEAKSTAFAHIKQMPSQKAEQRATRQRRRLSTQSRLNNGIQYDNYGRK
jgi:hypothetical protein